MIDMAFPRPHALHKRGRRKVFRLHVESLEDRNAPALVTQQLFDINQNTRDGTPIGPQFSSFPNTWAEYNGSVYFQADNQPPAYGGDDAGNELWKTDGTAAGTAMVKDINPGFYGSNPSNLTVSNGTLFFTANDQAHGSELWKSDGTTSGTVMVKDIKPGPGGPFHNSYVSALTDLNGTLYFSAHDDSWGIFRSDGTDAGTYRVKAFQPGNYADFPTPPISSRSATRSTSPPRTAPPVEPSGRPTGPRPGR